MSLRPIAFHPDGSIDAIFDEKGHRGTIGAADVKFVKRADGSADPGLITLLCPDGCGGQSTHPITGGATVAAVQEMFVRLAMHLGCPDGQLNAGKPVAIVQSHMRLHAERLAGVGVWQTGVLR